MWATTLAVPAALIYATEASVWLFPVAWILLVFPVFSAFMYFLSWSENPESSCDSTPYVEYLDSGLKRKYTSRKIPIQKLYEAYMDGKVDFKVDTLTLFEHRAEFCSFRFTLAHLYIFLRHIVRRLDFFVFLPSLPVLHP